MGGLELVVGGHVDVVRGMGVTGPGSNVRGGGMEGGCLEAEAGESDWQVDLSALGCRGGGMEDGFKCTESIVVPCGREVGFQEMSAGVVNRCVVVVVAEECKSMLCGDVLVVVELQ